MELIELHHEFRVDLLLLVSKLIVFLDLCREEKSNTSIVLIADQEFLPIHVVDETFQNLYAGKNKGSTCHHL
jgi:hypothetical protein